MNRETWRRLDLGRPATASAFGGLEALAGGQRSAYARTLQPGVRNAALSRLVTPRPPGDAGRETALLQRDPAAAAPATDAAPAAPDAYTLNLSDGVHENLSKPDAIGLLANAKGTLQQAVDFNKGEWAIVNESRTTFFGAIGGALTDLAGKNFPTYDETWGPAEDALIRAQQALRAQDVKAAGDELRTANDAYEKGKAKWLAYKAQLDSAEGRAEIGIAVVAVVAVVVIVGGAALVGGAAAGTAGVTAAAVGGDAALAATVPVDAAVAGTAATVPLDAAAAGTATTVAAGGTGTAAAGGTGAAVAATVPVDAAAAGTATTVAVGGTGAGATAGAATLAGVTAGGATADAVATATIADVGAAMTEGGPTAAAAAADACEQGTLSYTYDYLARILVANAPFTTPEAQFLKSIADVVFAAWKRKAGFPE